MEAKEIKLQMMILWRKIFNDSPEYVSMIFDSYFSLDNIVYHEEKGEIVSALLGIPYHFVKNGVKIKCLYLCGLSTKPEFRNRGIMTDLLKEINDKARENGYVFTFLIPASETLINYYSRHGYEKGMYRIEDRYTSAHDFNNDYSLLLQKEDTHVSHLKQQKYDKSGCTTLNFEDEIMQDSIIHFILKNEVDKTSYWSLEHTRNDIENIIKDNNISNGKVVVCQDANGETLGVAFYVMDEHKRVIVQRIFTDEYMAQYKILDYIKRINPESPISVLKYPEETDRKALIMEVYGAANPAGGDLDGCYGIAERIYNVSTHAKPYGMLRILDLHEILKFMANDRRELNFSILVKADKSDKFGKKYTIRKGKAEMVDLDMDDFMKASRKEGATVLTERELLEILFRKKESTNIIMEAFGIPRMIMNMSLLFD